MSQENPISKQPLMRHVNRQQMSWRAVDVEHLISEDHLARAIWTLVGRLNLSAFYQAIESSTEEGGRPAIDPQLLISLWVYAYSQGIGSAREVARRCAYDPAFQWLTGWEEVNYHTLADFRAEVNRLLDLDTRREVSLCLVPIGRTSESSLPASREVPTLGLETIPLSEREVEYPAMLAIHDESSLESVEEVNLWRGKPPILPSSVLPGEAVRLPHQPEEDQPKDTIEKVILRRGFTRTFDKAASITLAQLSTILDYATRGLPADFLEPLGGHAQLNDLYLIVHSVQGLKPGAYFVRRELNTPEALKEGEFRAEAHHLGLEQELPADACVDIFFLADLKRILERYGNRGYRAVQLEAGAIGGKIYLAAYTQHLGATGLTFFDDDVIKFFSPHAKDKSAIFLLAIGKPLKRKQQ